MRLREWLWEMLGEALDFATITLGALSVALLVVAFVLLAALASVFPVAIVFSLVWLAAKLAGVVP